MPPLNPALPTHDFRSPAQASKRDKHHKFKWQKGITTKSTRGCPQKPNPTYDLGCFCGQCTTRPIGPSNHNRASVRAQKRFKKELRGETSALARKAFRKDLADVLDPSSSPSSSDDDAAAVVADAATPSTNDLSLVYSYDKTNCPSHGQTALSNAVAAAVARFENTQTEKLVTREYDIIDRVEEHDAAGHDQGHDHDFEMIEHAHLE